VAGARAAAEKGALAAGTIESFLLWRLTGGKVHASDATNASRTLLLDIRKGSLGRRAAASCSACPRRCCRRWSTMRGRARRRDRRHPRAPGAGARHGGRPAGGDGRPGLHQARHDQGDLRHRLLRAAQHRQHGVRSHNRLLTTIAYQLDGRRTYALEGSIFIAGAAVQWLRDGLR
jgi:glycerol kinase